MKTERCATIAQFRGKIIMHPRLNEVIEDLRTFSRTLTDVGDCPEVILICGPAGVGKTTALKLEERAILESSAAEADNPEYLSSFKISVSKEAEAFTTWKQFWAEGYKKSLIGIKPRTEIETKGLGELSGQNTDEDLRQAFKKLFLHRHTKFLFIDEAQQLLCWGQDPSAKKNLEFLVSLATEFQVRCVMAGPYELKTLASLNGSFISRVRFIHFRAYGASKEDHRDFFNTIRTIEAMLPLPLAKDVQIETLFEGSLGCVGLLQGWLFAALQRVDQRSGKEVTQDDVLRTMLDSDALSVLAKEISHGEAAFAPMPQE